MQAATHAAEDLLAIELVERVNAIADESAARNAYRRAFERLRTKLALYPHPSLLPSAVFDAAARTVRMLAAACLPLATAVTMHLYPLCALQCVPLPLISCARFKRALLLRTIRDRSLILANAGSERTQGADPALVATQTADGIRIDGTYEYMSLGSVADLVLCKAKLLDRDHAVLCAADLKADSVHIGPWKFSGTMRLSDTCSVSFAGHHVPHGRYLPVSDDADLHCISGYQRSWFQLLLAESYLARLARLHQVWGLAVTAEYLVSLYEISRLREYSLRLLDDFSSTRDIEPLTKTTSALKLRVSLMAQSMAATLRARGRPSTEEVERLSADARELCYIKSQPTADEKILSSLGIPSIAENQV